MSESMGSPLARWQRRTSTHLALGLSSLGLVWLFERVFDEGHGNPAFRFSVVTGWLSASWLTLTLLLGPLRMLRSKRVPAHLDVRRDVGIWAGLLALVHTAFALQVHAEGRFWLYFVEPHPVLGWVPNLNRGALSNDLGLAALLIVVLLLALSSDWALRRLGVRRWKQAQRATYVLFALTAAHGVLAQVLERRGTPWVVGLVAILALAVVGQALGYRARRKLEG